MAAVGGFTLDLYCDRSNPQHDYNEFPHEYLHPERGAPCRANARKKGWLIGKEEVLCPKCNPKKQTLYQKDKAMNPQDHTDECRVLFEALCQGNYDITRREDGYYANRDTECCFKGWQSCWNTRAYTTKPDIKRVVERIIARIEKAREYKSIHGLSYVDGLSCAISIILEELGDTYE